MKPYLYSLIAAAAATGLASAQTTAHTDPVGYVSLGDTTPGQPAIKANTDVFASVPLLRAPEFAGSVSSVSGNTITLSGTPGLTASPAVGSFAPTSGIPYIIQIGSGPGTKKGLIAMVTSNTVNQLTVTVQLGDSLSGVINGDAITVCKATTVSNLFENSPVPATTQVLGYSGVSPAVNLGPDLIYEFDGTNWIDTDSFDIADNVILYPGESFYIRNQTASPITSIVVTGNANVSNFRTVLPSSGVQQDIPFSFLGGSGEVIGTSGLAAVSVAGDSIQTADNTVSGINKGPTKIIEFDGTAWIDTDSFDDVSLTYKLEPGVGYFLRSAAAADRPLANEPDYVPGL